MREAFRTEYLCVPNDPQCDVMDNTGKHCAGIPKHDIRHRGKWVKLCDDCYQSYKDGAWQSRRNLHLSTGPVAVKGADKCLSN